MKREGNSLSPVLRQAWDTSDLRTLTRKDPLRASRAHISVIGHITDRELVRHLTETEMANGLANRFIFLVVQRSKLLPRGGKLREVDLNPLVRRLQKAIAFGKGAGAITWSETAGHAWDKVYGPLSEGKPGLLGAVIGRAEAQVVRLASLYAVMDESKTIEPEHLMAAMAVWEYAEDSARYIFGDTTGSPVADQLYGALRDAGTVGMTRTMIRDYFGRNKKAETIEEALTLLLGDGRIRRATDQTEGRPAERWFAR